MPAFPPVSDGETLPTLLEPILKAILTESDWDAAAIYGSDSAELLVFHPSSAKRRFKSIRLNEWSADPNTIVFLGTSEVSQLGFAAGLIIPLTSSGENLGALMVLSKKQRNADLSGLTGWTQVAAAFLENERLRAQQRLTRVIEDAARIIHTSSSPSEIVNVLRLLSAKVTTCAVLLYGPLREDLPNGPFDYLEVQASWSKRHGEGIGVGVRLYLELYPDLLTELNTSKLLILPDMQAIRSQAGPLIGGFLRAERVRSALVLALDAGQRQFGVVVVATDQNTHFTAEEIRSYRLMTEFMAVGTMTRVLQQQHDMVQQGRAALLDAVTDGVIMIVPDPHHAVREGQVLTVNQCFTDMFGINQAQAQGLTLAHLLERMRLSEGVTDVLEQQWSNVSARDPSSQNGEFEMMHPAGHPATIRWHSGPVYQDKRVMGRIYIFHDVTAERAADRLRANFISRLSHELRTPLSSIKGYSQLILEDTDSTLSPRMRDYVETIFNNADHLNAMFSDVILIARADTGDLRLTMERANLPDAIHNTVRAAQKRASESGHTIELDLEDDLPPVQIDTHYIGQVLGQILGNAMAYAPAGCPIRIKVARTSKPKQLPHGAPPDTPLPSATISISDEGEGFSAEEAEQIFVPFYRGRNASAAHIEGTGLGLTMARSLVERQRGKLWAEARRRGRQGTHFHLVLPILDSDPSD